MLVSATRSSCHRQLQTLLAALLALFVASCAGNGDLPRISTNEANASAVKGYALSPGDQVRVTVFEEPNLTGDFEVAMDGSLSMPLIDPVEATGRTEGELAAAVASLLSDGGFVLRPRVSAAVLRYRPVYILGEVATPGEYPFTSDLSLLGAVAKAGGFTPRAKKSQVLLLRTGWPTGRLVDLSAIPLIVAPGDTIVVQESFF